MFPEKKGWHTSQSMASVNSCMWNRVDSAECVNLHEQQFKKMWLALTVSLRCYRELRFC